MQQGIFKTDEDYSSSFEYIQESFDYLINAEDSVSENLIREVLGWLEEFDSSGQPEINISSTANPSTTESIAPSPRIAPDETTIEPLVGAITGWASEYFDRGDSYHPSVRNFAQPQSPCTAFPAPAPAR
jgi:hypothetical protein